MKSLYFINPDNSLSLGTESKKSNKDIIQNEYEKLALICIENKCFEVEDAIVYILNLNPNFKNDKIFNSWFPIIFNIENIKRKMKNKKN